MLHIFNSVDYLLIGVKAVRLFYWEARVPIIAVCVCANWGCPVILVWFHVPLCIGMRDRDSCYVHSASTALRGRASESVSMSRRLYNMRAGTAFWSLNCATSKSTWYRYEVLYRIHKDASEMPIVLLCDIMLSFASLLDAALCGNPHGGMIPKVGCIWIMSRVDRVRLVPDVVLSVVMR